MAEIFEAGSLDGLQQAVLQQRSNEIKTAFDQKRNFYYQVVNRYTEDFDTWAIVQKKVTEFDQQKYNSWNQQWNNAYRSNNHQVISNYFLQANGVFGEMDAFLQDNRPEPVHSVDVENLKDTMLKSIETDFISLKAEVSSEVKKGIGDVLDLKAELGLEKNYQTKIEAELKSSKLWRNTYIGLFVASLLLGPLILFATFFSSNFSGLSEYEKWFLRVAVTVTFVALTYFFFNQYRLYQLISLRYSHMNGFLGGGATFISQIIGSEDRDLKTQMNQKIAGLFMDLDDIYGLVRKDGHPMEKTADRLERVVKDAVSAAENKVS